MVKNKFHKLWMDFALRIAQESPDERLKVGAIIVSADNSQVLSLGYNGNYPGGPNKAESDKPGESMLLHGEENALLKLDYNNHNKKVMYVTHSPCYMCSKRILISRIDAIVFNSYYRSTDGIDLLKNVGIPVYKLDEI